MPRVIVEWLEGRDKETRDALAKKLTEDVVAIVPNTKPTAVTVVFKENRRDEWYKGGVSAAEMDKQK